VKVISGVVAATLALTGAALAQTPPSHGTISEGFAVTYGFTVERDTIIIPMRRRADPDVEFRPVMDAIICNDSAQSGRYFIVSTHEGVPTGPGTVLAGGMCHTVQTIVFLAVGQTADAQSWEARIITRPHS
jgi:hypothetical protein